MNAEPRLAPYWELFDLVNDPNELRNVYNNPAYAAVQAELQHELKCLQQKYGDQEALGGFPNPALQPVRA